MNQHRIACLWLWDIFKRSFSESCIKGDTIDSIVYDMVIEGFNINLRMDSGKTPVVN